MKRSIRPESAALAVAAFVLAALNAPFWRSLYRAFEPSGAYEWCFIGAVFLALLAAYTLVLTLFALPRVFKPLAALLLVVTAGVSYFMSEYGVVIDAHMIQNAVETNIAESGDLISLGFLGYTFALGVLPAAILWRANIAYRPFAHALYAGTKVAIISLAAAAAAVAPFFMNFTSVLREHSEVKHMLAPDVHAGASGKPAL